MKICSSKWWIDPFEFSQPSYGYFGSYHDGGFKWFECSDLLDWGLYVINAAPIARLPLFSDIVFTSYAL